MARVNLDDITTLSIVLQVNMLEQEKVSKNNNPETQAYIGRLKKETTDKQGACDGNRLLSMPALEGAVPNCSRWTLQCVVLCTQQSGVHNCIYLPVVPWKMS